MAQWSTLARLVILYHNQLLTLAVLLVVKARAEARASHIMWGARTAVGVAQAEFVAALLQQQVWLLTWHHAHLFPPCRLGSSKSSLVQLQSLRQCL